MIDPLRGQFVERALQAGLDHLAIAGMDRINETGITTWAQAGMATGDLDGNGLPDVVVAGGVANNSVFLQQLDGTFIDATVAAGINAGEYDRSVALGDIDRDGDLDLFLGALDRGAGAMPGRSRMYINDGSGVFSDITALSGTRGSGHSVYAKFFDIDADGWLDLYVGEFHGTNNHLYRNNSNLSFTDVTDAVGLTAGGSTHAVAIGDMDNDRRPDVVVGQDYTVNNIAGLPNNDDDGLFLNHATGSFTDVAVGGQFNTKAAVMGLALVDVNYDARVDVYKTNAGPNFLHINHGWPHSGLPFTEEAAAYGIVGQFIVDEGETAPGTDAAVGWAALFFNADLDPWLDLYVTNGHIPGGDPMVAGTALYQENFFYRGLGPSGGFGFHEQAKAKGLFSEIDDRGAAMGDLDLDGDVDLLVMSPGGRLRYYENRLDRHDQGFLRVDFATTSSAPNGIGTQVARIDDSNRRHLRLVGSSGPTASNNAIEALFGLGHEPTADLLVRFPSGIAMPLTDIPANTHLTVAEPLLVTVSDTVVIALDDLGPTDPQTTSFTVTAHAHSKSGQPLSFDAVCSIECIDATPLTGVVSLGSGSFRREFRVPNSPGELRVATTFDDFSPMIEPRVHVLGAVDAAQSLITITPESVRAGSGDVVTVTVTPRDALGRAFPPGKTVLMSLDGLGPISPPVDLGDGRYEAQFAAPALAGSASLDVFVNGVEILDAAAVEAADSVSATETIATLYEEVPNPLHQLNAHIMMVELTPVDGVGRRLGPGVDVEIALALAPGSVPATVPVERILHQNDGNIGFVIIKPIEEIFGGTAEGIYEVTIDGTLVVSQAFAF